MLLSPPLNLANNSTLFSHNSYISLRTANVQNHFLPVMHSNCHKNFEMFLPALSFLFLLLDFLTVYHISLKVFHKFLQYESPSCCSPPLRPRSILTYKK